MQNAPSRSVDAKQKEKGRAGQGRWQVADGSRLAGLGAGLGHLLPPLVRRMPAKPSSGPPSPPRLLQQRPQTILGACPPGGEGVGRVVRRGGSALGG